MANGVVGSVEGVTECGGVSTGVDSSPQSSWRDILILTSILAVGLICVFVAVVESQPRSERGFDFRYFYAAGQSLRFYPADRLYDRGLQLALCQALSPFNGKYGPFLYPPQLALAFVPFTYLTLWDAYRLWQLLSLSFYGTGVFLLCRRFLPGHSPWLVLPLALAFGPFLTDAWTGGQLSVVGFSGITAALLAQQKRCDFSSGLALSLCFYKPPILLLMIPFLCVTKGWRVLGGLAAGGASAGFLTTVLLGWRVWESYFQYVWSGHYSEARWLLDHYVDGMAFFSLLLSPALASPLLLLCGAACLAALLAVGRRERDSVLIWSTVLTWSMFLNLYVPMYDVILVVPGILASGPHLWRRSPRGCAAVIGVLFLSSWLSRSLLHVTHLQLLTVAIIALGMFQMMGHWQRQPHPIKP
jgi:hypothetical protein